MPTFNQLVRKGRATIEKKSTAPALLKGVNTIKKRPTDQASPQKRGVCTCPRTMRLLKSLTQPCVRLPEYVSQTESRFLLIFRVSDTICRSIVLL